MRQIEQPKTASVVPALPLERGFHSDRPLRSSAPESVLKELWQTIWTHRLLFSAIFVVSTALALGLTLAMAPTFEARSSLEVQSLPSYSPGHDNDGSEGGLPPDFNAYLDTQIGILESRSLVDKVATKVGLAQRLTAAAERRRAGLPGPFKWLESAKPLTEDEAVDIASANLKVRQSRMNNLIEVLFVSTDPKTASDFVNALSEEYTQENLESRWDMARRTEGYLTKQLGDLRTRLEQSEKALQAYSESSGIIIVADRSSVAEDRLHELQQELSQAQADRFLKQSQVEMAQGKTPESVPQILDNETFRESQSKISDLKRQIADLSPVYTANNPKVARLQAQLDEVQKADSSSRINLIARLKNEFEAADRREKLLTKAYQGQSNVVSQQAEKMVRYNTLKHESDSNRLLYESLLQRVKQSSVLSALQATNVRVVDPATPPTKKFKPSRTINTALGALTGIILGFLAVFVREHTGPRLHRSGAAGRYIQAPELGVVPAVAKLSPGNASRRLATGIAGELTDGSDRENTRSWLDPTSRLSESFRVVMTSLLFSSDGRNRPRVIVVSSPGAAEGKTTVTINLGAALADTGRRVLLIDADLRCPRLFEIFNLTREPGLVELLKETDHPGHGSSPALEGLIRETEVEGMFVLPPGAAGIGNLGAFYSDALEHVIEQLRSQFDVILIDSPPLLPVPEARALARVSDGVILVLRAGVTEVEAAVEAEQRLRQDGSRLLGTVLNQANPNAERYYKKYARSLPKVAVS